MNRIQKARDFVQPRVTAVSFVQASGLVAVNLFRQRDHDATAGKIDRRHHGVRKRQQECSPARRRDLDDVARAEIMDRDHTAERLIGRRHRGEPSAEGTLHDPHRDETTLPLIPRAVAAGVPVLGICRGFQEMNVAFGGSLWQKLHEVSGHMDHREDETLPIERQYELAHEVILEPDGQLRRIAGTDRIRVNSLHAQGVRELGRGLAVEARAPDGVVEAFRVESAPQFALAVQWHPEWRAGNNTFSRALFAEFGAACRAKR